MDHRVLMPWRAPLAEGRFIERLHRFAAHCEVAGQTVLVHVPATGRMKELLIPGAPVGLAPAARGAAGSTMRKTAWTLTLVQHKGFWVHVDSSGPTRFLPLVFRLGLLPEFAGYPDIKAEPRLPQGGRLDFLLTGPSGPPCWVEAKSVTLVCEGVALFPDAPTPRGARHLRELARLKGEGQEAAAIFVIQRDDAECWSPHNETDPDLGRAAVAAAAAGVQLVAVTMQVSWDGIDFGRRVPVVLVGESQI